MSVQTLSPAAGDYGDDFESLQFAAIVADFDNEQPTYHPSKAAERRMGREAIDRQMGLRRHRTREREV